jgi:hypothetical protein
MEKTLASLLQKARNAPHQQFDVLITVANNKAPDVPGLSAKMLMENIYSATATGEAIVAVNELASVLAVEPNYEMHTLDDDSDLAAGV